VPITATVTWLFHPALLAALLAGGFGFDSVALATCCSMWLLALLTLLYIRWWRPHNPRTWRGFDLRRTLERDGMASFLRLAIPGIAQMSEWWAWEVTCAAVGALGERALSAHAIGYTLVPLLVMLPIGISIAISVRVGQLIGEGRPRHAQLVSAATGGLGILVVVAYSGAVSLAPERIIAFFASEETSPDVVAATREIWPLVSTFLLFDGLDMILNGAVRALSLQLYASIAVLVALWCLGVPAVLFVAFRTDAGLPGVWKALIPTYALLDALTAVIVLRADWARISADVRARACEADAAGVARELAAVAGAPGTCEMGAPTAKRDSGPSPGLEAATRL
jgi:MATE family multidrug resistance protein